MERFESNALFHETLQNANIAFVIAWLIDRSFGDKGAVAEAGVVQQTAKRLGADRALADVFVPVQLRSARSFGIVAVPDAHRCKAHRRLDLRNSRFIALGRNNVISGNMGVTGIEADAHWRCCLQTLHQFRYLLEAAAE